MKTERELFAEAEYEVVRLEATGVDASVLTRHPNKYVRALALRRLRAKGSALDDAELDRVAMAAGDYDRLYSADCVELVSSTAYIGQGIDMMRGQCEQSAQPVAKIADDILATLPPDRVIRALVHELTRIGVSDRIYSLTGMAGGEGLLAIRLRVAGARAPAELPKAITKALPTADVEHQDVLLEALSLAPLGSGTPESVTAVSALMSSSNGRMAVRAAACVLLLTDRPGDEPAPVDSEPRRTAVKVLGDAATGSWIGLYAARTIGPAAAPLLDVMIAPIDRALANPEFLRNALESVSMIGALGTRGRRAASRLFQLGERIAKTQDESEQMSTILDALGAIGAPAKELVPFVLAHTDKRHDFHSGVRALVAVGAVLKPEELDAIRKKDRKLCAPPHHPGLLEGYMRSCGDVKSDIAKLEGLAQGGARPP